ncbi:hypothetical protein F5883DRAFT_562221 [Diaporthe sp. PMI_573]|nr:hypothetical protein F5883DRAFT_562221 [Diaporthaceae sp. PMI_573]
MDDFWRDTGRTGISIYQQDRQLAKALKEIGLESLMDDNGNIYKGKGEALIIGILLAAISPAPADKTNCSTRLHTPHAGAIDYNPEQEEGNTKTECPQVAHDNIYNGYYKYIGFINADNLAPGSVTEYCNAFSAGFCAAAA